MPDMGGCSTPRSYHIRLRPCQLCCMCRERTHVHTFLKWGICTLPLDVIEPGVCFIPRYPFYDLPLAGEQCDRSRPNPGGCHGSQPLGDIRFADDDAATVPRDSFPCRRCHGDALNAVIVRGTSKVQFVALAFEQTYIRHMQKGERMCGVFLAR